MLRYIIGVSLITIVLLIVRRLANGRMLNRHRYALWLLIPVYMIVSPFLKINVPIAEELSAFIPATVKNVSYEAPVAESQPAEFDLELISQELSREEHLENLSSPSAVSNTETRVAAAKSEIRHQVNIPQILNITYISIAAAMLVFLALYNAGFVLFCRRNRNYIGKDPVSGLNIYGINHKGVPFLLFNSIYVDNDPAKLSKYAICHEACHYRHGDFAWVIVRHLVLIINWYNPLIWAAFILSGRDCELACDEAVIGVFGDESSVDYAETLLVMMQQRSSRSYRLTMSTGMGSGYEVMKKRIVSLKNPAKKSYKVLAMSLAALVMISGFSVLEPVAAESDSSVETEIAEVLALTDSNTVTAPEMREAPFDYAVSMPDVAQVSATEKNITFYRDGNAIESKLYLPEGEGPFETIVIRGDYCTSASNYTDVARYFANNGYAALIIGINYDEEIEARTYTGNVKNHVGDLVFEQLLDIYAVIDELRYLPDVDLDRLVLFGDETGGMFMAFVACEREEEFKGMVLFAPYLDNGQYVEFCDDPKYVGRIYEDLPECYLPTLFMHYESGILGETLKGCNIMPNSEFVYIENGTSWYDGNVGVEVAEAALPAIKSWG